MIGALLCVMPSVNTRASWHCRDGPVGCALCFMFGTGRILYESWSRCFIWTSVLAFGFSLEDERLGYFEPQMLLLPFEAQPHFAKAKA